MVLTMSVRKNECRGKTRIPQKQTHTPVEFVMLQRSSCLYPKALTLLPTSAEITCFISASPLLPCALTSLQLLPLLLLSKLKEHKTWKLKITKTSRN